jgi:hypothetical protein
MKKIVGILLIPLLIMRLSASGQNPIGVHTTSAQAGQFNLYGIKLVSNVPFPEDVYVEGYIRETGNPSSSVPWSATLPAGYTEYDPGGYIFSTDPSSSAEADMTSATTTASYAGVSIGYDLMNNILTFSSAADLNAVIDQLDADYDTYNDSYDALQDPNLTDDQQDDADILNGFDEVQSYKDFESLLPGYYSMRKQIANIETTWLSNGFTGTDPDAADLTFDDTENTIFNNGYQFKVGSDLYYLTASGLYINGVLAQASVYPAPMLVNNKSISQGALFAGVGFGIPGLWEGCASNVRTTYFDVFGSNDRYKLKLAVNSIGVRSSAKSKVVHFKLKSGNWKRSRTKMAVFTGGHVWEQNENCLGPGIEVNGRKPVTGWKKRRQLKLVARSGEWYVWRTMSSYFGGSFDTQVGHADSRMLTF